MNNVVEFAPRRLLDRSQRPVRRETEGNQRCALLAVGESEHLLGESLIAAERLAAPDTKPGCGDHHLHCGLTSVELVDHGLGVFGSGYQERNRRRRIRYEGRPLPNLRQPGELIFIRYDYEVPALSVRDDGALRPASRMRWRSSSGIGSEVKLRTCLREMIVSHVSMRPTVV